MTQSGHDSIQKFGTWPWPGHDPQHYLRRMLFLPKFSLTVWKTNFLAVYENTGIHLEFWKVKIMILSCYRYRPVTVIVPLPFSGHRDTWWSRCPDNGRERWGIKNNRFYDQIQSFLRSNTIVFTIKYNRFYDQRIVFTD